MEFSWDEHKNRVNFKKHGIYFEEARLIFEDVHFTRVDPRDYYDEQGQAEIREITIGTLRGGAVLVVCHTNRNSQTRIISARKATSKERRGYNEAFKNTAF
ncbi:MAG: BrnT family toxin [Candidatus Poribacteria bacterium]|nr:BrnT family toxin [Candidatus Poribacteria bacterium]